MANENDQQRIILNIIEGTFFIYSGDYSHILEPLFKKQIDGTSRWLRTDKIIFVPDTVPLEYVMKNYEPVYSPIHRRR